MYTVCAVLLESLSKCLEVSSEIDFYSYPGKTGLAFLLIFQTNLLHFPAYKHLNSLSPPGTELRRRSRCGPFQTSNLPLLPSAPICPSRCNHSGFLSVCLLRALKSAHGYGARLLVLTLHCCLVVPELLARSSPPWRQFSCESTLKLESTVTSIHSVSRATC